MLRSKRYDYITFEASILPSSDYFNSVLFRKKENDAISRHAEVEALGPQIVAHMILLYIILVQHSQHKQKIHPRHARKYFQKCGQNNLCVQIYPVTQRSIMIQVL